MYPPPQVLPDLYEMRKRGNLPDVDEEVTSYLWEELLPSGRSPDLSVSTHSVARLPSADVSQLPSSGEPGHYRRRTSLSVERLVDQMDHQRLEDRRSRPGLRRDPVNSMADGRIYDMSQTWMGSGDHINRYPSRIASSLRQRSNTITSMEPGSPALGGRESTELNEKMAKYNRTQLTTPTTRLRALASLTETI